MKALKIIGIIIGVLVVIVLVLGFIAPKSYETERTIVINAPKALVFDYCKYWEKWEKWSPWSDMDPTMEYTLEGKDGEVGAVYRWIGDPKLSGSGTMTMTGINDLEEVTYHLQFLEPWEDQSDGYTRVTDVKNGVQVAWGIYGKSAFPWNIMMLFRSMDAMMDEDFNKGLAMLKEIAESDAAKMADYNIREWEFPGMKYAGIRTKISFLEMQDFFAESYAKLGQTIGKKITGAPVGIYFSWDMQTMTTDMAAAFPVKKAVKAEGIEMIEIPRQTTYMIEYTGPYSASEYAHYALDYHIRGKGLKCGAPVMEEYITDPQAEPDSAKWQTNIYYFAE